MVVKDNQKGEFSSSRNYRDRIIAAVTFLGGLYWVLEFITPQAVLDKTGLTALHEPISYGFVAVGASAIGLGLINLLLYHGRKVLLLRQGWWASVTLLGGLFVMLGIGSADWYATHRIGKHNLEVTKLGLFTNSINDNWDSRNNSENLRRVELWINLATKIVVEEREVLNRVSTQEKKPEEAETVAELEHALHALDETIRRAAIEMDRLKDLGTDSSKIPNSWAQTAINDSWTTTLPPLITSTRRAQHRLSAVAGLYRLLIEGLFNSLAAAMFSLLAVYIAAAAFRAFRVRNIESALMMGAACLVILGQTSFGVAISGYLPTIRLWLLEVPSSAAFRAVKIGAAVAGLVMALRMWLSMESSSFGVKDKR